MRLVEVKIVLVFIFYEKYAGASILSNLTIRDAGSNHLETSTSIFSGNFFGEIQRASELKRYRLKNTSHDRFIDKSLIIKYCQRPAKCMPLNYTTCMGAKLPYTSSTLNLSYLQSQEDVQAKLQAYQFLQYVPICWPVIQPFLCALYMPRCEDDTVYLPSKEMCRSTLRPCKILYDLTTYPNCDDEKSFPSTCKNDIVELNFNMTGLCMEPLIRTDHSEPFYPDLEGCGLPCKDAFYTEHEHTQIHKLISYCVLLCIFLNLFTVITFIIDWESANKYPALAIFYINVCFLVSYSGWLIQFLGNETREDIVCKKDGSLRKSEPSATENLSCVIVFVMVYYFLIAGMVWFVIFTYAWHMSSLQALGKIQGRVEKKRAYFHLVAWSLPLILTITTMALSEIDGDYITGICFVGYMSSAARAGLLLAPLAAAVIVGGYIITRGLLLLIRVKIESREIISEHSSRRIRSNIVRMGVFALFMVLFCIITFVYHGYRSINYNTWNENLQRYVLCKLISSISDEICKLEARPSVAMLQLQLLAVFGTGVAMASWIWCGATLHSWARYIRRKFHCEVEEPIKLQKHKIIAQAFAKRKKFYQGGRISIECQNHSDPVGLNFDLNSVPSNELSITWAANLPRLVNRRGAVPNEVTCSVSSNNQSIDSEMSYSVRHVSIESRRNSGDSQLSVQIAELKATRKINGRRHRNRYRHKTRGDFRRGSRDISQKISKSGNKRESSTSLDSHFGPKIFNVLSNTTDVKSLVPNLKRRPGNAGLDGQHINNLLSNGKLVIPYNVTVGGSASEDEENVSVTIITSNHNLDLNDQLVMESLKKGLHIEDLETTSDSDEAKKDYGQEKRQSRSSRRSKRSTTTDDSSSPELKQLLQSSLNSGTSMGYYENNRGSKQSKTSIDVAVQANAKEIMTQTGEQDKNVKVKTKCAKTRENKKYKKYDEEVQSEKMRNSKEKYRMCGSEEEKVALNT